MCRPGSPGGHSARGCMCKCCSRARETERLRASCRFVVSWTQADRDLAEKLCSSMDNCDLSTVVRKGLRALNVIWSW